MNINSSCELSKATRCIRLFYTAVRKFDASLYIDNDSTKYWWMFVMLIFEENVCIHNLFSPTELRRCAWSKDLFSNGTVQRKIVFANSIAKCLHSGFYSISDSRNHSLFVDKTLGSKICQAISNWWAKAVFSAFEFISTILIALIH